MIPDFNPEGVLPVGRFFCSFEEAEMALVRSSQFQDSTRRPILWSFFKTTLTDIKSTGCKIPSVFFGGSFITSKLDPKDIDVAYLIDHSTIHSEKTFSKLDSIFKALDKNENIDAILIPWMPTNLKNEDKSAYYYYEARGRWDDFWQRSVPKADRDYWQRSHAFPKRGHLEVEIDGYR